jgi:outer membrane protein OmpA-like peptidoglycan-associated protein
MRPPFILVLALVGCSYKPPVTNGNEKQRQPINSQEIAARLEFCSSLGQVVSPQDIQEEEVPSSPEMAPASVPVLAPVSVQPSIPEPPKPLFSMRVYFAKNKVEFKPSTEQVEELQVKLKSAERVEIRVRNDATQLNTNDEKLIWQQALAAKSFLLSQGATPESIWLNIFPVETTSESKTPEGQAELRRVEILVFGGAK